MQIVDNYSPTAICNQAIDAAAVDFFLGNIEEGTRPAQVCLRAYSEGSRQLLRCANWNFARKQAPLFLLADATGQTENVGTQVPGNQFIYEYAMPQDCLKVRYLPWWPNINVGTPTGNITPSNPSSPIVDNLGQPPYMAQKPIPSRFLITSDQNYIPSDISAAPNANPGVSPTGRTVILSNVQYAQCIYTYDCMYPNVWDHQFRAALVAFIASEIAVPLSTDKKFGMAMRDRNIAIAQEKIRNARATDGQEGWHSSNLGVDWMRTRMTGGYGAWNGWWGGNDGGPGVYWGGFDSIGFSNGSAY